MLLALSAAAQTGMGLKQAPAPVIGVPRFQFKDSTGRTLDLNDFKGKFVLLNLWATWCGPCVEEMPSLDALQRDFSPQKLVVVAITEDHERSERGRGLSINVMTSIT